MIARPPQPKSEYYLLGVLDNSVVNAEHFIMVIFISICLKSGSFMIVFIFG